MQSYSPDIESLLATTNHGERVIVVGPANDPARATVCPIAPGAETFTPRVANLNFGTVGILRANRLATDAERARAWQALMAYQSRSPHADSHAIEHAASVLRDAVTYRLNN